jgi:hypothetical protein
MDKSQTQLVLVEAINTFRTRYVVEVPVGIDNFGNDKKDWALDTVTLDEATEFSQHHLGEQIVSHRIVTQEEALALCDQDNDYCAAEWTTEHKIKMFFTAWKE